MRIGILFANASVLPAHFSDGFEHERPIYDTLESITTKVKVLSASKGMAQVSWKLGIL